MDSIQKNKYVAVVSPVHFAEVAAISDLWEKTEIETLLLKSQMGLNIDHVKLKTRANSLHQLGFGVADSAHIAYAESSAEVLITCDDKLIKKSKKEKLSIFVCNPIEFILREDLK